MGNSNSNDHNDRLSASTSAAVNTGGSLAPDKKERNAAFFTRESTRFILYAVLVVCISEMMRVNAVIDVSETKFSEASYVEYMQSLLLLICSSASLVFYLSKQTQVFQQIFNLIFGLTTASFIREQDIYFEHVLGHGTWPYPVYLVLAFVSYNAYKGRKHLLTQLTDYMATKSYAFMTFGVITVFIFSRLYGRTKFWEAVMEGKYFRSVKNVSEECIELYGYLFLFFSVVELVILVRNEHKVFSQTHKA